MIDSNTGSSQRRWTEWLALGGLIISILSGVLLPVYTDETGWRFEERAAIDGGVDIMFNDVCGPNTIARARPGS